MKQFKLGSLAIDPAEYGSHGNAVLGIRGSGKSYTATCIAEHLFDAGIPFIAFDPVGIWRHLRVPGKGKGYPIVVAGGKDGDLPLTVAGTPAIVRAAMQGGISLVIDLFDINLSKADWRRIVTAAVRTLMHENHAHGLRHVFIEEAAEFIPQKPIDWDVYAEIEKLARMGGNSRLGYTLINQRSQEVSKAILELCENVFLHRQRGKNALENMDKWLQVAGATEQKEIIKTLPDLPQGQCWAWLGGDHPTPPTLIKVPAKNSFHPDRRVMRGDTVATKAQPVDVGQFVTGMRGQLEKIVAEAKANDPTALKAEVRRLTAELAKKPAGGLAVDTGVIEIARQEGWQAGHAAGLERGIAEATGHCRDALLAQAQRLQDLAQKGVVAAAEEMRAAGQWSCPRTAGTRAPGITHARQPFTPAPTSAPVVSTSPAAKVSTTGTLKPALQRVVNAIGWWRQIGQDPVDRSRACVVAGLSPKASTFGVYIGELIKLGLVESSPGKVGLTAEGVALAVVPAGDTREQIHDVARGLLGPQEQRVFDAIYAVYPREIARVDLANAVGLSPTASTLGVYIGGIAAYGIIENGSRGHVRAAGWLFP